MESQDLASQLAQRVGISREQANTAIALVSKMLLQKADPNVASGLLSKLPSSITGFFSDSEKRQFTTTRQDMSNEEMVGKLGADTGINDPKKAQLVTEEAVKLLQEKTGQGDLLGDIMGKFKKVDLNPFD